MLTSFRIINTAELSEDPCSDYVGMFCSNKKSMKYLIIIPLFFMFTSCEQPEQVVKIDNNSVVPLGIMRIPCDTINTYFMVNTEDYTYLVSNKDCVVGYKIHKLGVAPATFLSLFIVGLLFGFMFALLIFLK